MLMTDGETKYVLTSPFQAGEASMKAIILISVLIVLAIILLFIGRKFNKKRNSEQNGSCETANPPCDLEQKEKNKG